MSKNKEIGFFKKTLHRVLLKIEGFIGKNRGRIVVDKALHFFISQPLKLGNNLLTKLFKDDSFYHSARYAWVSPEDAKKMFVYGCARQVVKAGISLLQYEEFILDEPPKKKDEDSLGRMVIESVIDSQNVLSRKLLELLVNLINFSQFDRDEAYRLYLNAENLEHFLGRQADFTAFYAGVSGNIDQSILDYKDRIKKDLASLNIQVIWFLRDDWSTRKTPSIFSSVRDRYKQALPSATDEEKIVLGLSYSTFFADLSVSAHPVVGSRKEKHQDFRAVKKNIAFISMLCQHIARRLNLLTGFSDPNDAMSKLMSDGSSVAPELMRTNTKVFQAGDLVLAMDDLCEIEDCKTSVFGYTSCKIRFLTRPPLPETPTDWLPSGFVMSVLPKSSVRGFFQKTINDPETPAELREALSMMEKESDETLAMHAKNAVIQMHKQKILIPILIKSGMLKINETSE